MQQIYESVKEFLAFIEPEEQTTAIGKHGEPITFAAGVPVGCRVEESIVGVEMEEAGGYKAVEESMPSVVSYESEPFKANVPVIYTKKRKKESVDNNTRDDDNGKKSKLSGIALNRLARVLWHEYSELKMLYEIIAYYALLQHKEDNPGYKYTPKRRSKKSRPVSLCNQRKSRDGEPDDSDSENSAINQECSYSVPDLPMVATDVQEAHTCIYDMCCLIAVDTAVRYE